MIIATYRTHWQPATLNPTLLFLFSKSRATKGLWVLASNPRQTPTPGPIGLWHGASNDKWDVKTACVNYMCKFVTRGKLSRLHKWYEPVSV
jgi:hypothetical protein